MKITPKHVDAVLRTLPIGTYAGTRVPAILDETAKTSHVSLTERVIHVAYRNVETAMDPAPDGTNIERTVRALLYHELLHVMLTPPNLPVTNYNNLMEDERIETMGRGRFLDTDFRANVKRIAGASMPLGMPAKTFDEFLFRVVRFREGPAELQANLNTMLKNVCIPNKLWWELEAEYRAFVKCVNDWWDQHQNQPNQTEQEQQPEQAEQPDQEQQPEQAEQPEQEQQPEQAEQPDQEQQPEQAEQPDQEQQPEQAEQPDQAEPTLDDTAWKRLQDRFRKTLNTFRDPALDAEVGRMIDAAIRKREKHAGSRHGYAGTLNPYSIATRRDYKWFDKRGKEGNGFEKIHLRLCVDVSYSFIRSIGKINSLLASLIEAERKMPESFAVSVVAMGTGCWIADKTKQLKAYANNFLNKSLGDAIRGTERHGWRNVTVAVWDGDFGLDSAGELHGDKILEPLNNRETVIVSDPDNAKWLDLLCPLARRTIIRKDYAEKFISEVLKLLGRVL